jgi:hypothetical protein
MNSLMTVCREAFSPYSSTVTYIDSNTFEVEANGDKWKVSMRYADVEPEEEGDGEELFRYKNLKPDSIASHWDVLYAMLHALANREDYPGNVEDITVDGGSDCEAIFLYSDDYWVLKVR